MIIDLRTIGSEPKVLDFILEKNWWHSEPEFDKSLSFDTPISVRITIYKAGGKYVLEGSLEGRLGFICDRCLETFHQDVRSRYRVFMELPLPGMEEPDVELVERDLETDFIRGEVIELDEIIKEQLYLALPMKALCKEDCPGLCPLCGYNLNKGRCNCPRDQGHPGFSKLKDFKVVDHSPTS